MNVLCSKSSANKGSGLLPPPPSLLDVKPNLLNLAMNPTPNSNQKGLMNGPDITNPAMQNLLAQSPQGRPLFVMS